MQMENWLCKTCGTQFPATEVAPTICPICAEERQYIGHEGQQWTTLAQLQKEGYRNTFREHEPHLLGIGTTPKFAIGERALLVQTPQGNILWDCMSLLDDETAAVIEQLGGLRAIAISHPHYYTTMVTWAERFDAPIYLATADQQWVMQPSERIIFWSGDQLTLTEEVTLLRLGGHFPGGSVLHWRNGDDGRGALLTGDIISVAADRQWVSFMYSYPNMLPLSAPDITYIAQAIASWPFERLYGAWFETIVDHDAHAVVQRSANRYIHALATTHTFSENLRT